LGNDKCKKEAAFLNGRKARLFATDVWTRTPIDKEVAVVVGKIVIERSLDADAGVHVGWGCRLRIVWKDVRNIDAIVAPSSVPFVAGKIDDPMS